MAYSAYKKKGQGSNAEWREKAFAEAAEWAVELEKCRGGASKLEANPSAAIDWKWELQLFQRETLNHKKRRLGTADTTTTAAAATATPSAPTAAAVLSRDGRAAAMVGGGVAGNGGNASSSNGSSGSDSGSGSGNNAVKRNGSGKARCTCTNRAIAAAVFILIPYFLLLIFFFLSFLVGVLQVHTNSLICTALAHRARGACAQPLHAYAVPSDQTR